MKPSLKNIFHKLTGPTESDVVLMPDQVWCRKFTPWRRKRKNTWRTWTWSIVKGKQNDWKRSEKKPEVGVAKGGGSPAHWALSLSSCVQMPGTVRGRAASSPIPTITVTRHSTVSRTTPVTFDPLPEVSVSCRDSTETAPVPPPPRSPSVYLQPEPLPSMCSPPPVQLPWRPCSCAVMAPHQQSPTGGHFSVSFCCHEAAQYFKIPEC